MKTNQPIYLAWLVEFFSSNMPRIELHKKFHVRLTDNYGQNYVGITPSISIIDADPKKPSQLVRIKFTSITKVSIEEIIGTERYVPAIEGPKSGTIMEFNVNKMEEVKITENGKSLKKLRLTLAAPSGEQLFLSLNEIDFERYNYEVLGNEPPQKEASGSKPETNAGLA